jgi:hypothetical protein
MYVSMNVSKYVSKAYIKVVYVAYRMYHSLSTRTEPHF